MAWWILCCCNNTEGLRFYYRYNFLIVALISALDSLIFLITKVCGLADFHTVDCPRCAWFHWTGLISWLHKTKRQADSSVGKGFHVFTADVVSCLEGDLSKKNLENTAKSTVSNGCLSIDGSSCRVWECYGGILQHARVESC